MPHTDPGQRKALRYLRWLTTTKSTKADSQLPKLRDLAQQAGVAYSTMGKTIRRLQAEGYVWAERGIGIRLERPLPEQMPDALRSSGTIRRRWETLSADMRRDLLIGGAQSSLPSMKELRDSYGASYRSIKRAIQQLLDEGLIEQYGKTFRLLRPASGTRIQSIRLLFAGDSKGNLNTASPILLELISLVEFEALQRNINLNTIILPSLAHGEITTIPKELTERLNSRIVSEENIGTILLPYHIANPILTELGQILRREGKPLAVIDTSEDHDLITPMANIRNLLRFSAGVSSKSAEHMAQCLFEHGHRRIIFISPYADSVLSRNRKRGLLKEAAKSGIGSIEIHEFPESDWQTLPQETEVAISELSARGIELFAAQTDSASQIMDNRAKIIDPIKKALRQSLLEKKLTPLLQKAVSDTQATAWIAVDDLTAAVCLTFLENRGKRIPKDLSLLSFGDSTIALTSRISSYNFNCSALARTIIESLQRPESIPTRKSSEPLEIPGFITERRTSAALSCRRSLLMLPQ